MPAYTASVAAATAVIGYNILQNERWNRSPVHRILSACGLAGSAAILDTEGDLYIDEVRVSSFVNTATGAPQVNRDMQPLASLLVPAGAELQFIITDAPTTSPINITLSLQDIRAR